MYVVQTADMGRIILSSRYANELRSLPESQLSSVDAQCERHLAWWNTLDVVRNSRLHVDVSRVQLNQNLGTFVFCFAKPPQMSKMTYQMLILQSGRQHG